MKPCKHLDHDPANYPSCELQSIEGFACEVKFFRRPEYVDGPRNVQFCGQGRGRINGIFQCYNPGEMSCYEPPDALLEKGEES